ncbi:antibiotic biosynthesis monooxygenase family protein [Kitasatospora sp. NPDC059327]|uniref:antibiotic biosynthesis monooxygenase family protein n=1 Tax=Kitasatospora sp. NPDC059327 TaxID=3346803 RepID=UPI003687EED9
MAIITAPTDLFTLVNVFAVDPANQQALCDHLCAVTEDLIRHLPGFVSATFHLSLDGRTVVNYAQWQSREDFQAMHADPRLQDHFDYCRRVSQPSPVFCSVERTFDAGRRD